MVSNMEYRMFAKLLLPMREGIDLFMMCHHRVDTSSPRVGQRVVSCRMSPATPCLVRLEFYHVQGTEGFRAIDYQTGEISDFIPVRRTINMFNFIYIRKGNADEHN